MTDKVLIARELAEEVLKDEELLSSIRFDELCVKDKNEERASKLRAALNAPQQEAVAWQQSAAEVIASFVHLSANPNPDEWALVAVDAIRLLNIPPAHPAPSVSEEQNVPDTELPGMWEYADFSGGSTDFVAPSVPEGWQLVPKEPTPEMLDVTMFPQGAAQLYRAMLSAAPKAPTTDDRKDAERWRYIRRHLCLTGNGDGTCQMHALNLPCRIQGWPEIGESLQFHDAAIDAAMAAQKGEKE